MFSDAPKSADYHVVVAANLIVLTARAVYGDVYVVDKGRGRQAADPALVINEALVDSTTWPNLSWQYSSTSQK